MHIKVGPVGAVSRGHVLDTSVKPFEAALKAYDPYLYVKWNPKKLKGHGCWEIRRSPEKKRPVEVYEMDGFTLVRAEYKENNILNHVLDCGYLNYDALRKIKEMDTWSDSHWVHDIDYLESKKREKIQVDAIEELKYAIRYNRKAFQDYMELVKSGMSPHQILTQGDKWEYKS